MNMISTNKKGVKRKADDGIRSFFRPMTSNEKENTPPSTSSVVYIAEAIASPNPKRAKVSAIDNNKHRVSGFNDKWLTEFSWLRNVEGGMKCNLCTKHQRRPKKCVPGKAAWVDLPCLWMVRESILRHGRSETHKEAVAFEGARVLANTSLATAVEKEVTLNEMAMESAMKCLYWLCKRELPHTTNYVPLMNLCKDLGVDVLNALMVGENAKYTSERFIQEALLSFKYIVQTPLICDLKNSPFYTVMVDGTTDVAVKKELILYVRFLKNGKSSTHFLKMIELFDGKAATIKSAIVQTLEEIDVPLENMCALGSDGASVMLGRKGGVAALLKESVPTLIANHCVAHRLALASSQAAAAVAYLKKFKAIVEQLYRFYQYSAVRMAALHHIQEILQEPVIKITEAKAVRWLSHDKAVQSIRRCFPSIITSLEREAKERGDAQALGLATFVQKFDFIATLYMVCDLLPPLSQLSKALQRKDGDYTVVRPLVTGTIKTIQSFKERHGEHYASVGKVIDDLIKENFKVKSPTEEEFDKFERQVYFPYIDHVVENLEKRFPDLPLLESFSVFDPNSVPEDPEEAEGYGREQIGILSDHFKIDLVPLSQEWRLLKNTINTDDSLKSLSASLIMQQLAGKLVAGFPLLSSLSAVGLLLPTSTADCERGFSTLKRIKTELRNRLSNKITNCLVTISLEGEESTEIDISEAVQHWKTQKNRRIFS
ncbi:zinc finger protein 862-like [Mytilus galloprovincialis]|uniref:zinc finger protein 862-like n=1 Tax=Mytilus galloprovincialis TaxID=29158 RepID=UPI003F7BBD97